MIARVILQPEIETEKTREIDRIRQILPEILFLVLLLIWFFVPGWLRQVDPTTGDIDQSHWFLVLLGLIAFMLILSLCWWLLQHLWERTGLPELKSIILKFNQLSSCQQLNFLLASFALLLLAATGCLAAIC